MFELFSNHRSIDKWHLFSLALPMLSFLHVNNETEMKRYKIG